MDVNSNSSHSKYKHSDKISKRRKALFPTDETSSDLGHMSPLHSDSNSNFSGIDQIDQAYNGKTFFKNNLSDYDIFDGDSHDVISTSPKNQIISTPSEFTMSPLYLSPFAGNKEAAYYSPEQSVPLLTPLNKSPSSKLKTPHDTSTIKVNTKQPKRRLQEIMNPEEEENSHKKVRTALFPDKDISLPTKSFYPKFIQKVDKVPNNISFTAGSKARPLQFQSQMKRKRYGQINAGVRHKIKKPKKKNATKNSLIKVAMNVNEKSPLSEYLREIAQVKTVISHKQTRLINEIAKKHSPEKENKPITSGEEEPEEKIQYDSKKKFFKSARSKGIVTISDNIKLEVNKHKVNLINKVNLTDKSTLKRKLTEKNQEKSYEFGEEENFKVDFPKIVGIINKNLNKEELSKGQTSDLILSPTSQMCDMTSGLAINSPKRAKLDINKIFDNATSSVDMEKQKQLFPVFLKGRTSEMVKKVAKQNSLKKLKKIPDNQMLLDAGQKRFGWAQCHECDIVYEMGNPNEELIHQNFHNAPQVLKFNGWKNERVVQEFINGRIIKVIPGDSKAWRKKVNDLLEVVDHELGVYGSATSTENAQVYLYIKNKLIVGCLVAEVRTAAYKMLSTAEDQNMCSYESYPIKCGISRIWVSPTFRKSGIATSLVSSLKLNFIQGVPLKSEDIAFSSPTDDGKKFATKYFKTENYLIYIP